MMLLLFGLITLTICLIWAKQRRYAFIGFFASLGLGVGLFVHFMTSSLGFHY